MLGRYSRFRTAETLLSTWTRRRPRGHCFRVAPEPAGKRPFRKRFASKSVAKRQKWKRLRKTSARESKTCAKKKHINRLSRRTRALCNVSTRFPRGPPPHAIRKFRYLVAVKGPANAHRHRPPPPHRSFSFRSRTSGCPRRRVIIRWTRTGSTDFQTRLRVTTFSKSTA